MIYTEHLFLKSSRNFFIKRTEQKLKLYWISTGQDTEYVRGVCHYPGWRVSEVLDMNLTNDFIEATDRISAAARLV